jgi:hypothetical protein
MFSFIYTIKTSFQKLPSNRVDLIFLVSTLSLFFVTLSGIFWPVFILAGAHTLYKMKFSYLLQEKTLISLFLFFATVKLFQSPSINTVIMFRSSMGLYFFYFYFSYINKIEFTKNLLWIAVLTILVEFIFRIPGNLHYMMTSSGIMQAPYSRVSGFGNNSTITTTILVLYLFSFSETLSVRLKSALVLAIIVCGSGIGFIGLILFGVFEISKLKSNRTVASFIAATLFVFIYLFYYFYQHTIYDESIFYKLTPQYIDTLFQSKVEEARITALNTNWFSTLFGLSTEQCLEMDKCRGGDFGWKATFQLAGLFGISVNVYLLWRLMPNINSKLFSYLSIFHYSILLFPGAQIFLGYLTRRIDPPNSANLPTK